MEDHEYVFDASALVYGDDECGVCLQHYRRGETVVAYFPCKHHLHIGCYRKLLPRGFLKCPSDRTYEDIGVFKIPADLSHVRSFRLPADDGPERNPFICCSCLEGFEGGGGGNRHFRFMVHCGHPYHSECVLAVVQERHCFADQCNARLTNATDFVRNTREIPPEEEPTDDGPEELIFDLEMD